jgi:hypothetical protein
LRIAEHSRAISSRVGKYILIWFLSTSRIRTAKSAVLVVVTTASPSRKLSRQTIRSDSFGSEIGIPIGDKPVNLRVAKRLLFKGHDPSVACVIEFFA